MHKSLGNGVDPDEIIKKYGSDILRLWAASCDYHVDVRCSDAIFRQLSEVYRKIRNTARILLANIGDFNPDTDMVDTADLHEIDKWVIARVNELVRTCRDAYNGYEFHMAYNAINTFCTNDLSKLYVDITKDRLYTDGKTSASRRAGQTAMYTVLSALTRLVAPILCFTAEEIWKAMPHAAAEDSRSVFLNEMPAYNEALVFPEAAKLDELFALRDDVMKALELARAAKMIGKSLDAKVTVYTTDAAQYAVLDAFADKLALVFITSQATVVKGEAPEGAFAETVSGIAVLVENADGEKCDRCWMYTTAPIYDGEGEERGCLCGRCHKVVFGA